MKKEKSDPKIVGKETEEKKSDKASDKDKQAAGSDETDEVTTAGGREGHFSDSDRDQEPQWSPGANQIQ